MAGGGGMGGKAGPGRRLGMVNPVARLDGIIGGGSKDLYMENGCGQQEW